jgi:predicted component of type VI protein secretion system
MPKQTIYLHLAWRDPNTNQQHEYNGALPITIGRRPYNHIVLNRPSVSRLHARLELLHGDLILTDQNSANGTRVNGQAIKQIKLISGEQFDIGGISFQCEMKHKIQANQSQCSNPNCKRIVSTSYLDCPWCGTSLAHAHTVV